MISHELLNASRALAFTSGSYDKTIKRWDCDFGRERATLTGHANWVFTLAFPHDGKTLASAGHDKTVRI